MNVNDLIAQLEAVQRWRNQVLGLGVVPPEVHDLLAQLPKLESEHLELSENCEALRKTRDGLTLEIADKRRAAALAIRNENEVLVKSLEESVTRLRAEIESTKASLTSSQEALRVAQEALANVEGLITVKQKEFDKLRAAFDEFKRLHNLG